MATRFFTYRFGGVRRWRGPVSGLIYEWEGADSTPSGLPTPVRVEDERDAEIFLRMGTPESGFYLFRETDAAGNPIGPFPPVDPEKRQSMIDPKRFPSDDIGVTVGEWREATEDLADPTLFYHYSRQKLIP